MLQETIAIIKALAGNEYLYFDKDIQVTKPPYDTYICAVAASPKNELWVMDSYQTWYQLKENEYQVLQLVYLRIKGVQRKYNQPRSSLLNLAT